MALPRLLAACLALAATAFADPFTGRYDIESLTDSTGVSVSGFIEFTNAPAGTAAFNLGASFVSDFEIVISGPIGTYRYDDISQSGLDEVITFNGPFGAAVLVPVPDTLNRVWSGIGALDGQGDPLDSVSLRTVKPDAASPLGTIRWDLLFDSTAARQVISLDPPAWHLVNAVPEPGTIALLAAGGALAALRRRRRAGKT
jgi:hypothetical protein